MRNGVRAEPHSPPAAGRRKVASEHPTNVDRSSTPPSTGRRVVMTRCPNKRALPPALLRPARAVAPVDRNWPVEIDVTGLLPEESPAARLLIARPVHSGR